MHPTSRPHPPFQPPCPRPRPAGIVHLLPHCAEAQEALGPLPPPWLPRWLRPLLPPDYPLYLVLVVWGYCLVFWVERVLFDVHGEGHSHCQHSNVFSHSRCEGRLGSGGRRGSGLGLAGRGWWMSVPMVWGAGLGVGCGGEEGGYEEAGEQSRCQCHNQSAYPLVSQPL